MKTIYEVTCNTDLTEGRGYQKHVAAFFDKSDAEKCAEDQPKIMGVGKASHINKMCIYTSYQDWKQNTAAELRRKALSKLTEEEKFALGIND